MENPDVGLCAACVHATVQTSARDNAFWRCRMADRDERFLRYPPLPVMRCDGFVARPPDAVEGGEPEPGPD